MRLHLEAHLRIARRVRRGVRQVARPDVQQLRDHGFVVLDDDEWRLPAALVEDAVRDPNPRRQPTTFTHDPWGATSHHSPNPQP